ncbi:HNH endonuclease signature motif containing protein [Gulosibacter faecalis]|uniref:DUF222 domain-containing protein n=1 Tax=Gulosibacter faecalis TaxID=272240 RepID=A0ABW5UXF6_9MICO
MTSTAHDFDDLSDESLRAALDRFHADLRTRAAVDASDFSTYATIYRTAQAYTNRDCGPAVAATKRDQTFRWHLRSVAGEFACDAQLTDNSLMNRAHNANDLFTKFPYWHDALSDAAVQVGHVNAMLRQHTPVAERHYERYGKEVLRYAKTHTVPQTESFAKQLAAKLAREDFERAHKAAFAQRRVLVDQDDYGMTYLTAYLPAATAAAIHERLSRDAQAMAEVAKAEATARRGEDGFEADARTLDQHRADILADTLLTATAQTILDSPAAGAARVKAVISIVTPVMALRDQQFSDAFRRAGGSDTCAGVAMLNGLQPMSAAEAREWAADGELERILTHPISGHVITADTYVPPASLRRYLRARDVTCRFPGCRRPAHRCDLDHTTAWQHGGKTHPENCGHLCVAHHTQKHEQPWQVRHLGGGVLEWITPLGRVVVTVPEPPGPRFVEVDDPPPF